MGEENQYMSVAPVNSGASAGSGTFQGGASTTGSNVGTRSVKEYDLRSHLNNVMNYRNEAKNRKAAELTAQRDASSNQLFDASLNATDHGTAVKCDRASRMGILAKMIRDDAASAGVDWSMYDDVPTIDAYLRDNPEKQDMLKGFVTAEECPDATAFAEQMGFLPPEQPQESEKSPYDILYGRNEENPDPIRRGLSAIRGSILGIGEGILESKDRIERSGENVVDIWNDDSKSFPEKFNQTFLGELLLNSIGGTIGDVGGGLISGMAKGLTTQGERDSVSDTVAGFVETLVKSDMGQEALNYWYSMTDEQREEAKDLFRYVDGMTNFALGGGAKAVEKPVIYGAKNSLKKAGGLIDNVVEQSVKGTNALKKIADNAKLNKATRNMESNVDKMKDLANRIGQGGVGDINNSTDVLKDMSNNGLLKDVKTFKDLDNVTEGYQKKAMENVDNYLEQQVGGFNRAVEESMKTKGGFGDKGPISTAIDDLKNLYTKTRDSEGLKRVEEFESKFNGDTQISYKEINDFARKYGTEFRNKAFNKDGSAKFSELGQGFENTREGIKDMIHSQMPDDTFKKLDKSYSTAENFQTLVKKSVKGVNDIEKKLRSKGWFEKEVRDRVDKAVGTVMSVVDVLSGKRISSAVEKLSSSLGFDKTLNIKEIEENLPKMLSKFSELNEQLNLANSKKEAEDILNKTIDEIRVGLTSVNGYNANKSMTDSDYTWGDFETQQWNKIFQQAKEAEDMGDFAKAKELYDKSLEDGGRIIKEELGDKVGRLEKTIGRYGENEPTFYMTVKDDSPETLKTIVDLANNKFKQKSVFLAKPAEEGATFGIKDASKGISVAPGITIKFKNKVGIENGKEFDKLMDEIGQFGATILPAGDGIEIYNLTHFDNDPMNVVSIIDKLKNSEIANKRGIEDAKLKTYEIQHLGYNQGEDGALGLYDAIK